MCLESDYVGVVLHQYVTSVFTKVKAMEDTEIYSAAEELFEY